MRHILLKPAQLTITGFLTLIIMSTALAQNPNLGTAGAQFLKIPIGARSAALGGAVTGMSTDATALFWNPAGIVQKHTHALHFSRIPWMTYFNISALGYTMNLPKRGTIGIHMLALGMEKMEITTELQPGGTGEYFDAQDLDIGVSYALKLMDHFSMGMTAKYIQQRIWNETATGVAFDFGTHYDIDVQNIAIAMSIRNFGADIRMEGPDLLILYAADDPYSSRLMPVNKQTESYSLPLIFQFGFAVDLVQAPYLHSRIAVDGIHFNDNDEQFLLGWETTIAQHFVLRGGYKINNSKGGGSLGLGLYQQVENMIIKLDYAFVLHEQLGDTRFLSLDLIF